MPSIDSSSVAAPFDQYDLSKIGNDECLDGEGWEQWLRARRDMFQQKYLLDPEQLVADQRREQSISRDYQGREILELLQNAADAAKVSGTLGRVYIEINATALIVANTGRPFTVGGVKSLQTPDLSPKHSKNSKYIGSKGLGFRSILNWTRHPIILSGHLGLAYNADYVHQLINTLAANHEQILRVLGDAAGAVDFPVPLLPFPMRLDIAANRNAVENVELLTRCQALKDKGFDTVVGMPFDRDQAFANGLKQVKALRPEFLMFAEGLSELAVTVRDAGDNSEENWQKTWRSERSSDAAVTIVEHDEQSGETSKQKWRLYTRTGLIDKDLLQDKGDPDSYHLVVAFTEEGLAEPDNLYSFFPTSIPLPVHALCHASLELEQNRKHLQDGAANHFVLERLAEFLAEKIEEQGELTENQSLPRQLIAPDQLLNGYQADIEPFEMAFGEALKTKKILPTVGGQLVAAAEAFTFPEWLYSYSWLPADIFPAVVIATDQDEQHFCEFLEVEKIGGDTFVSQLRSADNLSIELRAEITLGILDEKLGRDFCYKGLLLDAKGNPLDEEDSVYLPGGSLGDALAFPDWARVKILHDPLWALIRGKSVRDSAKALSAFGVQEYALGALLGGLVSAANAAVEDKGEDEDRLRSELLTSLYQLYNRYDDQGERPSFPKTLTAIVLNHEDTWVSAKNVYFGKGYSSVGEVVAGLYAAVPEKLIADTTRYEELGIDEEKLSEFLAWLGVAGWPRIIQSPNVDTAFNDYALPRLSYPAIFSDSDNYRFENFEDLPSNCRIRQVRSLDGLDKILTAECGAILAWLAKDPRASSWLQSDAENGSVAFVPPYARNYRSYKGGLPSYIHWKIKTSPWLSGADGKPLAPISCMVNDAAVSGIFPKPRPPSKDILKAHSLSSELLRLAWLNAGVRSGIEDLDPEEIYGLLLELPERDPGGKLVGKLYNWLIKSVDFALDESGEQYQEFCEEGEIYATQGDEQGYYPVAEAYHVDAEGFPAELLNTLPIVRLPKKRGAEKVRRLFGINVLDKKAVNETVVHHSVAACTEVANQHFQNSKKYIEIYRRSQFAKAPGHPLFDRLQLLVCDQVQSQITFEGATIDNPLPPSTYSLQEDRLYLCCKPEHRDEPYHSLLANTLGDAIASVFGLTEGDPFSKIYQCDEASRAELLAKMIGDELDDDLDAELQRLIEEGAGRAEPEPTVTMGPIADPPVPSTPPIRPTQAPVQQPVNTMLEPPPQGWNLPESVSVEPIVHTPKSPGPRVGKRVGGGYGTGGSGSGNGGGPTHKSDGKAGESLAVLFEKTEGRFPLYIGHITGYETIAADVLSFRSAEDREVFRSDKDQSRGLIERVIEAKEKWTGGVVELTVNEVNTAAEWKDKYYIYRFTPFDAATAQYQMTSLSNPLAHLEAVTSSINISLDSARTAQKFRLRGESESEIS